MSSKDNSKDNSNKKKGANKGSPAKKDGEKKDSSSNPPSPLPVLKHDGAGGFSPHLERLNLGPRLARPKLLQAREHQENTSLEKRQVLRAQIDSLLVGLSDDCNAIIFDIFPEKIQKLDNMYKNAPEFNLDRKAIHTEISVLDPTKITTKDQVILEQFKAAYPANVSIMKCQQLLQQEVLEMAELLNSLSIWVTLNVPRISDGNNFGVEVQGEISEGLGEAETAGYTILDGFASYHVTRGELVEKLLASPGVEDYKKSIRELDEKTFMKLTLIVCELRNSYMTLYDLLSKNLEVLTKPRGEDPDAHLRTMY